ncbi:MAG: molecular chaperone DnaJ [Deltaproteobacteria bacterium]|nr:MAG: molecular chaperone DnaJ [Deltaproteobacteria bacterium]
MTEDYYQTLGVEKGATSEEIKRAYRRLAKKYHPDINKDEGAEDHFKKINEAYKVLSDPKARAQYERFGSAGPQAGFGGDFRGFDFGFDDIDIGDIFSSFFGGGGKTRSRAKRGRDIQVEIPITLEEVAAGVTKTITLKREVMCDRCQGSGGEPPSGVQTCSICGGTGVVQQTRSTPFGIFSTNAPCSRCNGTGKVIVKPCSKCHGRGRVREESEIEVEIPAGVADGDRLRMSGKGEAGAYQGRSGDLYVYIMVLPHKLFKRDGADLLLDQKIPFHVAALGGKISVPTIDGEAELKIPAGTEDHSVFKLRGQGLKRLHGYGSGNLLVTIYIDVPKSLNHAQKRALKELSEVL